MLVWLLGCLPPCWGQSHLQEVQSAMGDWAVKFTVASQTDGTPAAASGHLCLGGTFFQSGYLHSRLSQGVPAPLPDFLVPTMLTTRIEWGCYWLGQVLSRSWLVIAFVCDWITANKRTAILWVYPGRKSPCWIKGKAYKALMWGWELPGKSSHLSGNYPYERDKYSHLWVNITNDI